MELHANSSNNTVYADADGHIALFPPAVRPRRDDRFDWTRPVDGSDPATDWRGVHGVEDSPHVVDPPNGWIQNTNNWPYSAAGRDSPERDSSPGTWTRSARARAGCTRSGCWIGRKDFTLERLRDAAFDSYLTAFARLVPALLAAYDSTGLDPGSRPAWPSRSPRSAAGTIAGPRRAVPTSLAVVLG